MNRDLLRRIVCVEARFADGTATKIATGFRLRAGLVLTAQHVVEARDTVGGARQAVEVRVHRDGDAQPECTLATVLWRGEERLDPGDPKHLDATLLELEAADGDLEPFDRWVSQTLVSSQWETQGYTTAGSPGPTAEDQYLRGHCEPARERETSIGLLFERRPPRDPDTGADIPWFGLSGAPVLVREGGFDGHLYGIVRSGPEAYPDKLFAVGLPALLRDTEFCRHVGYEGTQPPKSSLVEALHELLIDDRQLAGKLAGLEPTWRQRWLSEDVDGLIGLLANESDLGAQLNRLRELREVFPPGSPRGKKVQDLALLVTALGARHQIPEGGELDAKAIERIRLGSASECFAEAFLAGAFGVPPRYEPAEGDLPRAYLRVPTAQLETGIRDRQLQTDQLEELVDFLAEFDLTSSKVLFPSQVQRLRGFSPGDRAELLHKQLESRLKQMKKQYKRPAYLVANAELRYRLEDRLERFLGRLQQALPSLQLVVLDNDKPSVERAIEQEEQLFPLWEILDLLNEE